MWGNLKEVKCEKCEKLLEGMSHCHQVVPAAKLKVRLLLWIPRDEGRYLSFYELVTPDGRTFGPGLELGLN